MTQHLLIPVALPQTLTQCNINTVSVADNTAVMSTPIYFHPCCHCEIHIYDALAYVSVIID